MNSIAYIKALVSPLKLTNRKPKCQLFLLPTLPVTKTLIQENESACRTAHHEYFSTMNGSSSQFVSAKCFISFS